MDTPKSGKYAVYLRKSREDVEAEAGGKYETLARHAAQLERLAKERGYFVAEVYRELVSGDSLAARPECQRLIRAVAAGEYDGVLVVALDRLTRGDMIDQGTIISAFRYTNTPIITPAKTYDPSSDIDLQYMEMSLMFGRMELSTIKRRFVEGKERSVRDGQYIGSFAPFGYDKVTVDRKHTLRPNADAPTLARWYEDVAAGLTTPVRIARDLNAREVPSPRGHHWDKDTVRNILANPINKGCVRWNAKRVVTELDGDMRKVKRRRVPDGGPIVVPGLHEAIVSDELWQACNDAIAARADARVPKSGKRGAHCELQNPLATLLVCAKCGRAMQRVKTNGHSKAKFSYSHSPINRVECWQRGATMQTVVDAVITSLEEVIEGLEVPVDDDAGRVATSRVEDLRREADEAKAGVANLLRLAEKGLITDEEFAGRRAELDARRDYVLGQISHAQALAESAPARSSRVVELRAAVEDLRNYQGRAREVNDLLKGIIERIEYERDPETGDLRLGVFLR